MPASMVLQCEIHPILRARPINRSAVGGGGRVTALLPGLTPRQTSPTLPSRCCCWAACLSSLLGYFPHVPLCSSRRGFRFFRPGPPQKNHLVLVVPLTHGLQLAPSGQVLVEILALDGRCLELVEDLLGVPDANVAEDINANVADDIPLEDLFVVAHVHQCPGIHLDFNRGTRPRGRGIEQRNHRQIQSKLPSDL